MATEPNPSMKGPPQSSSMDGGSILAPRASKAVKARTLTRTVSCPSIAPAPPDLAMPPPPPLKVVSEGMELAPEASRDRTSSVWFPGSRSDTSKVALMLNHPNP